MSSPLLISDIANVSIQKFANHLFKADLNEQQIRALPAQTLFLGVKHLGVSSCADIILAASAEQCRLMLDFDCWENDEFAEERFWEWLGIADEDHGLEVLQKLIRCFDLKVVALIISRHVQTQVFSEKTENPPGPGFYTPDQGHTWIQVTIQEGTKHFHLTRLLALIFETNAELFYQILAIPGVATPSMLEEESYSERQKRLISEGIPEKDLAFQVHAPLSTKACTEEIKLNQKRLIIQDIQNISPLIYDAHLPPHIDEIFKSRAHTEELEGELSYVLNAALIRWNVPFHELEKVKLLASKVKGAMNIGIEILERELSLPALTIFEHLGLQKLYRLGLTHLAQLHKRALKVPVSTLQEPSFDPALFALVAGAREAFPEAPLCMNTKGELQAEQGKLQSGTRAFEHLTEVEAAQNLISSL